MALAGLSPGQPGSKIEHRAHVPKPGALDDIGFTFGSLCL